MKHFFSLMRSWAALLLLPLLAGPAAQAQAPAWQRAALLTVPSPPLGYSFVRATVADANGNVYLAGDLQGTAYFGATVLTTTSNSCAFVAKWNRATNTFAWAQKVDGTGYTDVRAVGLALGSNNALYLAGSFTGQAVSFDGLLLASNSSDAFVAKLTDTGTAARFTWVKRSTGAGDETATGLALNGSTAYLTGTYGGLSSAGPAAFDATTLPLAGSATTTDVFVAKLSDGGSTATFDWALRVGDTGNDVARAVAVSGTSVYLGGYITGPVSFGSIRTYNNFNARTCFLAKLTDAGTSASFGWVEQPAGLGGANIFGLATNGTTVYAAGDFNLQPTFGAVQLASAGALDGFVVKLTDAGPAASFVWGYRFGNGGNNYDGAQVLAVSGPNVYVAGYTEPYSFLAGLTDLGTTVRENWTKVPQHLTGVSRGYALALGPQGAVYLGGTIGPPATFDAIPFNFLGYNNTGYLASLTDPRLLGTAVARTSLPFALSPNPARSATVVQLPAVPGGATATLTLTDALGRTLRTETLALPAAGRPHALDLTGLAPGLYAVQVCAGDVRGTQRLVVE